MALEQFLQDKKTNTLSAMRLALFWWVFGVSLIWGYVSIRTLELQPIPESVVAILGLLLGGKVVQRFAEQ